MSAIVRQDGLILSVNSERVKYGQMKKADFERILKAESESFGKYVRVNKSTGGSTNISFSEVEGVSTGDFIKSVLPNNQSLNAIYAETIVDQNGVKHQVCVLIIDGSVLADFDLSDQKQYDKLDTIFSSYPDTKYNIFCAADESLIQPTSSNKPAELFTVPDEQVESFSPVVPFLKNLKADDTADFLYEHISNHVGKKGRKKANTANGSSTNSKGKTFSIKNILMTIFLIGAGYHFYNVFFDEQEIKEEIVDPYLAYRNDIAGAISPIQVVNEAMKVIYASTISRGWELDSAEIGEGKFNAVFKNVGGDISNLTAFKNEFGQFNVVSQGGNLIVSGFIKNENRGFPYVIYRVDEVDYLLYEEAVVKSGFDLSYVDGQERAGYLVKQYNLEMQDISLIELQRFSAFLKDKPIAINKITIKPTQTGNSIALSISIYGAFR